MAWEWQTNVTNEDYWVSSGDNELTWSGSEWVPTGDGLQTAKLSPVETVYDYDQWDEELEQYAQVPGPLYGAVIRAIRVYYTLDNPPNTENTAIDVTTPSGDTTSEYLSGATGVYERTWTAGPGEGIISINLYYLGDWYEMGSITRIDVEMVVPDPPEPEPTNRWTGFINCREIVL